MAQRVHIDNVKAFRVLETRLGSLSAQPDSSVLKVDIDGLDQAKCKWPRNLCSAKVLSNLWRPQVHVVGFIAHGVPKLLSVNVEFGGYFKFVSIYIYSQQIFI